MPSLSLLRSVRRSRWRTRLVAGAVAAGVLAGPLVASPAEAHGPGVHYVTITGWMELVLTDNPEHPTTCRPTYTYTLALQQGQKTSDRVDIVKWCGGDNKGAIVFNARLRDDRYVDIWGNVQSKTSACGICPWDRKELPFNAFVPEDFTQTMPSPVTVGTQNGFTKVSFKVIVDGP